MCEDGFIGGASFSFPVGRARAQMRSALLIGTDDLAAKAVMLARGGFSCRG